MKCDTCMNCSKKTIKSGSVEVGCVKNGSFSLSLDYINNFDCPLWSERVEEVEAEPQLRALVIIKCGRDIPVVLDDLEALNNMYDQLEEEKFIYCEDAVIRCSEVAAIQILRG